MSKKHAYAYEAGYRDGSIHYELEHCPACKNVADLQAALAENAKLRDFAIDSFSVAVCFYHGAGTAEDLRQLELDYHELGIDVRV